jgi:CheY-like chemotaxis protein
MTPPPRVLYVDDEPNLLAAFVRLFRKSNLEIHTTQNPLEALALLEQTSFDVVASDYNMPHLNGAQRAGAHHRHG